MEHIIFKGKHEKYFPLSLHIRVEVFVDEQGISPSLEQDEYDNFAEHYLFYKDSLPVATCRVRETEEGIKIERMCVLSDYRKYGIAKYLMNLVLQQYTQSGRKIYLHAQEQVCDFYKQFQFYIEGESFYEADIKHYKMVLKK